MERLIEQENLEIVRTVIEAFHRGDLDTVFELADPQVPFDNRSEAPGVEDTYIGREGFMEMFRRIWEVFEDYRTEPLQYEANGDRVAVLLRETAHGRHSGLAIDRKIVLVETLREGKLVHTDCFPYRHSSLRAVLEEN